MAKSGTIKTERALMKNTIIKIAKAIMVIIATIFLINAIIGLWYMHISVYYEFDHISWKIFICSATGSGMWGSISLYLRSVKDSIEF